MRSSCAARAEDRAIPYLDLAALLSAAIPLRRPLDQIAPYAFQDDDIRLVQDVLDKQILDTDGARVVRVNDIELVRVNGHVIVSNVDIGDARHPAPHWASRSWAAGLPSVSKPMFQPEQSPGILSSPWCTISPCA